MSRVSVIGSGFSGLAAAAFAAKSGHEVTIYEKNDRVGGRARMFDAEGFRFDMGPSWYWMPDIFDRFFAHFGKSASDYYILKKLDPGFQIIFQGGDVLPVPGAREELYDVFEKIEPGSSRQLSIFLREAEEKYNVAMDGLVYRPAHSLLEFISPQVLKNLFKTSLFSSVSTYVRRHFRDKRLIALLEFPALFLGAMPDKIPALYTLMNHAALTQGTYYPMGGMVEIVRAMEKLVRDLGVRIELNAEIAKIKVNGGAALGLEMIDGHFSAGDAFIAAADYHHVEQSLLDKPYRNYNKDYWDRKVFAPSCLIYYVGLNRKISGLLHHNLYFDTDFQQHAREIYQFPQWPTDPLFYVCAPSKTDPYVAPEGMENLFILVPVATGLEDSEDARSRYFERIIRRIEAHTGEHIMTHIMYKKTYCVDNFKQDYHAFKGNAYGLANTLRQTAFLKPKMHNKRVHNLIYAGQLTVPGPGVPPSLISGQIAAKQIDRLLKSV